MKAHWFAILTVGSVLWGIDKPYVMAYVANHPGASVIYANIAALIGFYVKSPLSKT